MKKIKEILGISKAIRVFESLLLCIWQFECSVHRFRGPCLDLHSCFSTKMTHKHTELFQLLLSACSLYRLNYCSKNTDVQHLRKLINSIMIHVGDFFPFVLIEVFIGQKHGLELMWRINHFKDPPILYLSNMFVKLLRHNYIFH